jgi:heterotetrameric sarcosine oxidase gamma subunit
VSEPLAAQGSGGDPAGNGLVEHGPVARSPIAPAAPVRIVDGWEVSGARATAGLTLTDCTPLAKVQLRSQASEVSGVGFGRAGRDADGTLVVGSGPGEWLLIGPPGRAGELGAGLDATLTPDDGATWVDLTHGRALMRLTGSRARAVLARLCGIDFGDDITPDGAALRTSVAALATDIVRDDRDGGTSYLLHCERSSGQYLFDVLLREGADLGIEVDGFRPPGI